MCGIIGCFSKENCYGKLFSALKKLEYRGYDSAGIAMLGGAGEFSVRKKKGGAENLAGAPLAGDTGIGHTRWATHGAPSDANAHPHLSGKFALVHNGIIENYSKLKAELVAAGEVFCSETDSEVIVKLIDRAYTGDFFAAVAAACARLSGSYAVAVLCEDYPGEIVCARCRSPLVAGAAENALYVCSDIPTLCGEAEYICTAADGEFIHICGGEIRFCNAAGEDIPKVFTRVPTEARAQDKRRGSYMEEEIYEIPRALSDTLVGLKKTDFAQCARVLRGARRVFAIACGTAYHAALAFKDAVESDCKLPVLCHTSSEFRYREPLVGEGDLVVAVSQSGETADTMEAARLAKGRGAYVLAVTNIGSSSLAAFADFAVVMRAGPEIAVAATKSYNCQLLCLYYIAAQMYFYKFTRMPAWFSELFHLPEAARAAFDCFPAMRALAEAMRDKRSMYFLGRDADVVTAKEGALKVKEIAYVFAEGYAAGELKHGTLALVEEGFPVLAVSTVSRLTQKTENALAEVKSRGAFTVLFSQSAGALAESCAACKCRLPAVCERLMPAVAVIPLQYFACRMCLERGFDPDKPRNLAKSVTVE
ncbi:MAG TPA: glutamine--fructose-6-phosphate transaminase (isomerizing) [Candidatus Borkfalkia excrementigallinarum]|uniref:Glutamine--fructose-6-phosphate aminotransferase [isomerizing] n=1 Tax=Candidatus Borkfalkia excrementigallinarum TaxID=2838506 RepID=A0A9D2CT10_9FIRM|nr:glutamine--fructose-6-phosphate transaminase (isomerizing) [Candidatus Borkfalkia excrementigallinarum]